jgi:hypothetical protein
MIGGLVGGFGTLFGVAIASSRLRRLDKLLPIAVVAIVLGSLVEAVDLPTPYGTIGFVLLFVSWQAAVVGMIAHVLCTET